MTRGDRCGRRGRSAPAPSTALSYLTIHHHAPEAPAPSGAASRTEASAAAASQFRLRLQAAAFRPQDSNRPRSQSLVAGFGLRLCLGFDFGLLSRGHRAWARGVDGMCPFHIPAFQHSSIPASQHSSIPAFKHSSIPVFVPRASCSWAGACCGVLRGVHRIGVFASLSPSPSPVPCGAASPRCRLQTSLAGACRSLPFESRVECCTWIPCAESCRGFPYSNLTGYTCVLDWPGRRALLSGNGGGILTSIPRLQNAANVSKDPLSAVPALRRLHYRALGPSHRRLFPCGSVAVS